MIYLLNMINPELNITQHLFAIPRQLGNISRAQPWAELGSGIELLQLTVGEGK